MRKRQSRKKVTLARMVRKGLTREVTLELIMKDETEPAICISYLLLHNKLPQNLAALNNKRLLPHDFFGLMIKVWLGWVSLTWPLTRLKSRY